MLVVTSASVVQSPAGSRWRESSIPFPEAQRDADDESIILMKRSQRDTGCLGWEMQEMGCLM